MSTLRPPAGLPFELLDATAGPDDDADGDADDDGAADDDSAAGAPVDAGLGASWPEAHPVASIDTASTATPRGTRRRRPVTGSAGVVRRGPRNTLSRMDAPFHDPG